MDNDTPKSEAEARAHIAHVRKEKRLDEPDSNTSDLENALIILSEQLYQKSTHFLLELIQNADDNTYAISAPTLNITFSDRMVRIDCNELGFSKANTEAICKIGRSTKKGLDKTTRYIGEKGIGFKSVFKIADVVWISSGHYSFKFDKHARLGMIAPAWASLPEPRLPGYTSMYMQLTGDCDTGELLDDLRSMDPRLLIFLRKLRQLNITVRDENGVKWSSKLGRQDLAPGEDGGDVITLNHNADSMLYKIIRQSVTGLPEEPKRLGCSVSEILLAFPLDESNEPLISSQKVYAFLPIRDYGFNFLIQADFLLIASREDIDSSSNWNHFLLNKLPDAFRKAVREFNTGELRYSWMRYLPSRPQISDFFWRLESSIIQPLATEAILESLSGELSAPSKLRLVPATLCDDDGLPLVQSRATKLKYLSPKYSVDKDSKELSRLGVLPLTPKQFIIDLKLYIEDVPREFHEMPDSWHACLCKALFRLINDNPSLKSEVSRLEIVPLKDGRWRSASRVKMCFSDSDDAPPIPIGISIVEIDSHASSDLARRSLFILLGAQTISNDMVCKAIVSTHSTSSFRPNMVSRHDLISHVAFLYHASWKNSNEDFVWMATECGANKRSCEIYIDSQDHYSSTEMFRDNRNQVSFIHEDYFKDIFALDESLLAWLVDSLHLAEYPRLVPHRAPKIKMSEEFQLLLKITDYLSILLLLKDQWESYHKYISRDDDPVKEAAKARLRDEIGGMVVNCRGGGTARLKETMLPLSNMVAENMKHLSFIDIPDPESRQWRFLSYFGVVVNAGAGPFIQCLRLLKESGGTLEQVAELYKQIFFHSNGHEGYIQKEFSVEHLIFAPRSANGRSRSDWINTGDCVWDGPRCLQKTPCIRDFYPDHGRFFCLTLGLSKADWRTLMNEAQSIEAFDNIEYISDVFISISEYLHGQQSKISADTMKDMIATLTESPIFPVRAGKSQATFDYLSSAQLTDKWFIADREHLSQTFDGLVPLLSLKAETIGKIAPLVATLGWEHRLLSRHVRGVPETGGRIQLTFEYTKSICAKARYITRLLPSDLANRAEIIGQLCNAKVYTAERVSIQWTLKAPDGSLEVVGRADSGRVKITPEGKALLVYLRKEDSDVSRPPYELQEELTAFCGLTDPSHISLLHWIVSEPNIDEIDSLLKRKGLQNDLPELEALAESLKRAENPQFWDKESRTGRKKGKRNYHGKPYRPPRGRKTQVGGKPSTMDVVQSFMDQFNMASSWSDIAAQPWDEVGAEEMLAHLCRLEKIDPFSLLSKEKIDSPLDKRLRTGGAFPDDAVGLFCKEDPMIHKKTRFLRPAQHFPASVLITRDRGIRISVTPTPVAEVGGEILLAGEVYASFYVSLIDPPFEILTISQISKMFEREMGPSYRPEVHWTSHFRNRSGLDPFTGDENKSSTFTIEDDAGSAAFTQLLLRHGYEKARSWPTQKRPTYHIEVSTTEEDILGQFTLEPFQVQKAWLCHKEIMAGNTEDIFILIRISDIRGDPEVALFVDPWQMHADGKLLLASDARYFALFEERPDFITLEGPGAITRSAAKKSGKRISKLFSRKKGSPVQEVSNLDGFYSYKTLKIQEIRLLELFPGQGDTPITGTVSHVPVDKATNFCAISYAWGPALKPYFLHTSEGKIPLTTSLNSALKRLRSTDMPIILWADAICINQSNDYEKALQIRLLPTIFQSAEQVFAWIGDEDNNSHKAMETLMQIKANAISPDEWPDELPRISSNWQDGVPLAKNCIWRDIASLFELAWFQRVWIIQEVVLAADVRFVCGAWDVDWDDLFSAVEICLDWAESLDFSETRVREMLLALKPAYTLGLTRKAFKEMKLSPSFKLIALLDSFAHTQATKECDKLFALLGISSDAGIDAFDPDYHSPVESVVRRYAAEFIRRGNAIDILYRAGLSKSYDFSSWIPKWTSQEPCRTISTWRGANGIFSAGGSDETQARILPHQPDKLHVAGAIIDQITQVGTITTAKHDVISVIISIHKMIDELEDYPTGESKDELRLKLPIGNAITPCADDIGAFQHEPDIEDEETDLFDWNSAAFDVSSVADMVEFLKQNRDARDLSWRYWSTAAAFLKRLSYGRFSVTRRGYVGFSPNDAMVGDLVCVFTGGAVPFVVRSKEEGVHRLIGECYVHGVMYGESVEFEGIKHTEFVLE